MCGSSPTSDPSGATPSAAPGAPSAPAPNTPLTYDQSSGGWTQNGNPVSPSGGVAQNPASVLTHYFHNPNQPVQNLPANPNNNQQNPAGMALLLRALLAPKGA